MNSKTRLQKLETRLRTDATVCPHLPQIVREYAGGTIKTLTDDAPCACGRPRLEIHLVEVEMRPETSTL
jgi:hypothetical protein